MHKPPAPAKHRVMLYLVDADYADLRAEAVAKGVPMNTVATEALRRRPRDLPPMKALKEAA